MKYPLPPPHTALTPVRFPSASTFLVPHSRTHSAARSSRGSWPHPDQKSPRTISFDQLLFSVAASSSASHLRHVVWLATVQLSQISMILMGAKKVQALGLKSKPTRMRKVFTLNFHFEIDETRPVTRTTPPKIQKQIQIRCVRRLLDFLLFVI